MAPLPNHSQISLPTLHLLPTHPTTLPPLSFPSPSHTHPFLNLPPPYYTLVVFLLFPTLLFLAQHTGRRTESAHFHHKTQAKSVFTDRSHFLGRDHYQRPRLQRPPVLNLVRPRVSPTLQSPNPASFLTNSSSTLYRVTRRPRLTFFFQASPESWSWLKRSARDFCTRSLGFFSLAFHSSSPLLNSASLGEGEEGSQCRPY